MSPNNSFKRTAPPSAGLPLKLAMCPPVGGHIAPDAPRAINKQWCRMHNRHINRIETDAQQARSSSGALGHANDAPPPLTEVFSIQLVRTADPRVLVCHNLAPIPPNFRERFAMPGWPLLRFALCSLRFPRSTFIYTALPVRRNLTQQQILLRSYELLDRLQPSPSSLSQFAFTPSAA